MTRHWLIVILPDDLLCIFRKEIAARSVESLVVLVVVVAGGVLIMISEVMIHYTDVRAGLTNHYVISQLPHFPTFRPQISKLLQITH